MSSENNHINYSAADIEMYLSGKLTAMQMHALEKAALDDPFLAEAIEGYEGMKNTEWNNELVVLRSKIQEKGTVAKVIPLHKSKNNWWKTVAAILILGGGIVLTFVLTRDDGEKIAEPQIAQVITEASENDILPQENTTITESLNPSASGTTEEKKINKETASPSGLIEKLDDRYIPLPGAPVIKPATSSDMASVSVSSGNVQTTPVAPPVNTNTVPLNDQVVGKRKAAEKIASAEMESVSRQNVSNALARKEAALNNFFTAQVVGADNMPLPFTNFSIKKDNFGTYADAKGMVRLVSTDSVLNIDVRSVGYLPKTITLHNNPAQTKIVLQEADQVRDKAEMDGYASNAVPNTRRALLLKDSAVNVEPADGWDNYNTYVANNIQIPDATLKGNFNGAVELSFDVNSNGTISNIRVSKSMGPVYDEAAKRLIMEGPQWKVKKGRKSSAKVKVQF